MSINQSVPAFHHARVLVVGDIMLDKYLHGKTQRISPEAPVPVIHLEKTEYRAGGAANVAMNLSALGVQTSLIGVIGEDEVGQQLHHLLTQHGIDFHPCHAPNATPTICKTRIISQHQQLLRIDQETLPCTSEAIAPTFAQLVADFDIIILSDYAKGALNDCQPLIQLAKAQQKKVLIDPKGNDFSKYQGADLITPNMSELRQVCQGSHLEDDDSLYQAAHQLIKQLGLSALLVTRSEAGMTLFSHHNDHSDHNNQQPPTHYAAKAKEVYDVTGAGDTVIATLAAGLAADCSLTEAVELANLAAGIVVGKLGTATVTPRELDKALHDTRFIQQGYLSEADLLNELSKAKAKGETIVMTNGCFDILHTGHVAYLAQAKALGDRLLVAINTDASIKRLKGSNRPANPLKSRAHVLAALRAVDWVVAFDEDTPTRIIEACAPNYLVKGGDNQPENIPGAQSVIDDGGQVLVMDYIDGFSTTATINRINQTTDVND
nr:bifunctional D-glycero-beta-D-manno-heptose-7-phosphate kinase/D-glycero-beta-D-manno-heptose 1-phosphate adenylyltransferase HldE [Ostreibacterium oceani]